MERNRQADRESANEKGARGSRKAPEQAHHQVKEPGAGVVDADFASRVDDHAAILGKVQSGDQRASLTNSLQRTYGNSYVQRLVDSLGVQAKLTVGHPDDAYEQEADRVAEAVTSLANGQGEAPIQRQPEEEEEELQAKTDGAVAEVTASIEEQIHAQRGAGQPLSDSVRASLEPHFGRDFSRVRLHTDAEAGKLSRDLGATAFTTGTDVFFREGAYQPETDTGKKLIAHELTHVVQQSAAPAIQRAVATEDGKVESPAEAGLAASRFAAVRGLWETMVVAQLRGSAAAMGGKKKNLKIAMAKMDIAMATVASLRDAYADRPYSERTLSSFYNLLCGNYASLEPHLGMKEPLANIRKWTDPDGEWLGKIIAGVRKEL